MRMCITYSQFRMYWDLINRINGLGGVELIYMVTFFVTLDFHINIYKIAKIVPTVYSVPGCLGLKVQGQAVSFNGGPIARSYKVFYKRGIKIVAHIGTPIFDTVTILAHGESCQCFLSNINRLLIMRIGTYIAYNPDSVS